MQRDLFDIPIARKTDPATSHEAAAKVNKIRRGTQVHKILERLRRGPATNVELAELAIKYSGRVSDLRALGYNIQCVNQNEHGVTTYVLVEEPSDE